MSIARTADVDDDGTGTTGTIRNNAWKTAVYDQIDGRWSEASTTSTGSQNDFSFSEADTLRCNNATSLTLTGLTAPTGPAKPAKRLIIVSVGAGTVVLNDQNVGSSAANRIITGTGATITLAAGTGWAFLVYDSTTQRWRVVGTSVVQAATPVVQSTTSTGSQNDFALTASVFLLRANNATALTFTGLSAGVDGQLVAVVSVGAGTVAFNDQSGSSSAANRIITGFTATVTLTAGTGWAFLVYDTTTARWRLVGMSNAIAIVQTTTSTGTQNDFALTNAATVLRCNNATALTLTGLSAGYDGQVLEVFSVGAGDVAISDQAGGSTAANRIITGENSTLNLPAGLGKARLVYDVTTARWRVLITSARQVKCIFRATGDVSNSGTTETDLKTYSMDAGRLAINGDTVRILVWGTAANNANSKTYKLYFGATVICSFNTTAANQQFEMRGEVSRTAAATQIAMGYMNQSVSGYQAMTSSAPTETLSGAVTIKMTGQSAVGSSDITAKDMSVDFHPAP